MSSDDETIESTEAPKLTTKERKKLRAKQRREEEKAREERTKAIIAMSAKGVLVKKQAEILDVSEKTIERTRKQFSNLLKELDNVDSFTRDKVSVFEAAQAKLLKSAMSDEKLEKANVQQLVTSLGILYDKNRLETGQSTQNISQQVTKFTEYKPPQDEPD